MKFRRLTRLPPIDDDGARVSDDLANAAGQLLHRTGAAGAHDGSRRRVQQLQGHAGGVDKITFSPGGSDLSNRDKAGGLVDMAAVATRIRSE